MKPEPDHSKICSRREALLSAGAGFGMFALLDLLKGRETLAGQQPKRATGADNRGAKLDHPPKARRVVQLFMNGGASQMDTFDYKPKLAAAHGTSVDFGIKAAATSVPGTIMKSPFEFKQHGECGRWVSSVFPHLARHVDEMAFLMAMRSKSNVHGPASYLQNTGFLIPGFPCMGAWISYGLGSLTDDLPTFVVLPDPRGLPYNNAGNFTSGFLPTTNQGVMIRPTLPIPIANLAPPTSAGNISPSSEAAGQQLLLALNAMHKESHPGDSRLQSRIESYELAAKMQLAAPEALDLSRESAQLKTRYGFDDPATKDFAVNCLTARRLLERGVRYVQVWSGTGGASKNWDNHSNIPDELPFIARSVDQPIAAFLEDLKSRGLLEDTLVIWTSEFGRMPFTQGSVGRDHNGGTFVTWMAGGGIRPGVTHGISDEYGYQAADQETTCYDMHATILHLLGINHTKLTYRYNGVDRRLTDVHGRVITEILNG